MSQEVVMPRLSDSMEEGTILAWLKAVGDEVAIGDELVEIETDKANMVFEADVAGTLVEIAASEGDTVALGEVIARVGEPDEAGGDGDEGEQGFAGGEPQPAGQARPDAPPSSPQEAPPEEAGDEAAAQAGEPAAPPAGDGRVKASPLARRIARERGIDLAALAGSGPGGRIIKQDVESAPAPEAREAPAPEAPEAPAAPAPAEGAKGATETLELNRTQRTIARRMAESKATVPHFYLQAEIEMSRAVSARERLKARDGRAPFSLNDMVVKASALALRDHRRANGAYRDGRLELYERVNVGLAVAAEAALIVPTIFDADRKGLARIASEARELAAKVREGKITPPELSGATFTVSNLGMYGVSNFHPVINPPQAAILAVGEVAERAVVRGGELKSARLMGVTLACDHRILYGAEAAELLARIRALLEEPVGLAL